MLIFNLINPTSISHLIDVGIKVDLPVQSQPIKHFSLARMSFTTDIHVIHLQLISQGESEYTLISWLECHNSLYHPFLTNRKPFVAYQQQLKKKRKDEIIG